MRTIYKYELEITDEQVIEVPRGSILLSVGTQPSSPQSIADKFFGAKPCIWAKVETQQPLIPITIYTIGTGHEINQKVDRANFLGTYQVGGFVGHVFYKD